jgi:hypothetical protein
MKRADRLQKKRHNRERYEVQKASRRYRDNSKRIIRKILFAEWMNKQTLGIFPGWFSPFGSREEILEAQKLKTVGFPRRKRLVKASPSELTLESSRAFGAAPARDLEKSDLSPVNLPGLHFDPSAPIHENGSALVSEVQALALAPQHEP